MGEGDYMSDCVCDKKNFKTCVWHRARMPDMEKREYIEALEKSNKELQKERDELKETLEKLTNAIRVFTGSSCLAVTKPSTINWSK